MAKPLHPERNGAAEGVELPEGWAYASLEDVTARVPNTKPEEEPRREFRYIDISSISSATRRIADCKTFRGADAPSRARRPVRPGDVLFSNVRTYLRNIALVTDDVRADLCSTGFTVLRPTEAIDSRFLLYSVLSDSFVDRVTELQTGTHYPAVSDRAVLAQEIAVAPLAEQKRIVAKIDTLLARVDSARERLAKVPAILKRFRQSVLAAACSGRLTVDWRESEAQDWQTLKLEKILSEPMANGRSIRDAKSGFPVLRLTALKGGRIDLSERKIGAWSAKEARPWLVRKGDFLISRGNGSLSLVGRGGLVEDAPDPVAFPDLLIRVRTIADLVLPGYLRLVWESSRVRDQIENAAHTTAGIHKVSQKDLAQIEIPVPPLEEQREIVRRVQALFRLADTIEKRVAMATARAEKLMQSILAKAFRGELVPREAELARREGRNYEPASALLAKLRSESSTPSLLGTSRRVAARTE